MLIGDFNVIYTVSRDTCWNLRLGIGPRVLADHAGGDWGFNFHLGGDLFPVRPAVISADADFGTLGAAGFAHGRVTVGAVRRRFEVYAGYDAFVIGHTAVHGPLVGVRLWH